jgi:hypothetical protein
VQSLNSVTVADSGYGGNACLGELSDVFSGLLLVLVGVSEEQDFGSSDDSGFAGAGSGEFFEVLAVFGWQVDSGVFCHTVSVSNLTGQSTKYLPLAF